MTRWWTRRRRLILRTAVSCGLVTIGAAAALLLRPKPAPYKPGEKMAGLTSELARELPPDYPRVRFVDVAREAGLSFRHFHGRRSTQLPEDMGSGVAIGDYDDDGWLDVFLVNEAGPLSLPPEERAASPAHNKLFHNDGDGTFTELASAAGVDHRGCGQGAAWADYDNDGRLDLVVTNFGNNLLYHNEGGEGAEWRFREVSLPAGLAGPRGFWTGASWADYDRDGWLDLYICGYVKYRGDAALIASETRQYATPVPASLNPSTFEPERNLLYHNNRDGTFTERAGDAGVENPEGRSLSASWCDFDGDGWIDLYVANDVSDNMMYRNLGDGTFEDVSHNAWVADYRGAMGLAVGDWDGDQDPDIFITHWIAQENALYNNLRTEYADARMKEAGSMRFMDVADQFGLGQSSLDFVGWGAEFMDVDNDGRLDLLMANGSTFQQDDDPSLLVPMRSQLYWNRGPSYGYYELGEVAGTELRREVVGRGLAAGDYDNDGDLDAVVAVNGGPAMLLRNDGGNANHWLKVRLNGGATNRFGVGAKLRLMLEEKAYVRYVGASSSYLSQSAVGEELFGLGRAERVSSLEIEWPDGTKERLVDLPAKSTVLVSKGEGARLVAPAGGRE